MLSQRAYAPDRFHSTTKLTPAQAQANLAAYLDKTSSNAYFHPDASLSQSGIQFPAQSGSQGGLAIHHLRRIEAGLRGENLIAESNDELRAFFADELKQDLSEEKDENFDTLKSSFKSPKRKRTEDRQPETNGGAVDADQYAQEQTEILEEIGNDTLAGQGEQVDSVPEITSAKSTTDKAARKKAKQEMKAKQKQERQAENARRKAQEAEELPGSAKKKSKKPKDTSAG